MSIYDLFIQLPVKEMSEIMHHMPTVFKTKEEIAANFNREVTEEELQKINSAAQKIDYLISFSFKQ